VKNVAEQLVPTGKLMDLDRLWLTMIYLMSILRGILLLWLNYFPSAKLEKLALATSNHYPILLDRFLDVRLPCTQHNFRFKIAWKLELGFDNMLKESW
jgi:hypothetical protein